MFQNNLRMHNTSVNNLLFIYLIPFSISIAHDILFTANQFVDNTLKFENLKNLLCLFRYKISYFGALRNRLGK